LEGAIITSEPWLGLGVALGLGLLIGAERERRKHDADAPAAAGIRTFAVTALSGALAVLVGGPLMLAAVTLCVAALVALSYRGARQAEDPGITTEIAQIATVLLGALAMQAPGLAAMAGVAIAILLAARTPLHHFVGSVLTEQEIRDTLLLAGASLVVLPLLPDRALGPFGALNPHAIWIVVVLVLSITAVGHLAVRALGARFGLPVAGLAAGFVSSAATIAAMGGRARRSPEQLPAAVAGAVLSTVATIAQMSVVIGATSPQTLIVLAPSLISAGVMAAAYGAVFTLISLRSRTVAAEETDSALRPSTALIFAGTVALVLMLAAALRQAFGAAGVMAAAGLGGLVDAHAAAISVAALVAVGQAPAQAALLPILVGLTTNTATKLVFAIGTGGRAFALRVVPGLILVTAAAWVGGLLSGALG
jgi:uncharacterized membrane protein (DUF4010 family)